MPRLCGDFLCCGELRVVKLGIEAAFLHKALMVALLDDMTVTHNDDVIRLFYRGQAVGDDKARSALHQLCKGVLHEYLGTGVDRRCRLVENEHLGHAEHDSCDAQ